MGAKKDCCVEHETKEKSYSPVGYAFGPGQGSILVHALVAEGAGELFLAPDYRNSDHRDSPQLEQRGRRVFWNSRGRGDAPGRPRDLADPLCGDALPERRHRGISGYLRCEPRAAGLLRSSPIVSPQ